MHLPIAHVNGFEEENEELHAQLHANSGSHNSHEEEEGSQSQGSKGSGGSPPEGCKPVKDLPCPRCQSMNTKFCYYNNYSVNQPRHFCRNCQRYWTVGGTLRNVPVGGGSRKKHISRSRSRSDPYYRPGTSPTSTSEGDTDHHHPGLQSMAMANMSLHPDASGLSGFGGHFPELSFHPSQLPSLLQFALQHNNGMYSRFLDRPGLAMSPEEEAELQAIYEAQSASSGLAAMMSSGLFMPGFMPELEPGHLALMHKAQQWAEAQRMQALARRQTAWAEEREIRECKPSVSAQMQRQSVAVEELRHRQPAGSLHQRPGFWETALMHSRPIASRRPGDHVREETKSAMHGSSGLEEGGSATPAYTNYSQGYDDSSPWGSGLNAGPEMYY